MIFSFLSVCLYIFSVVIYIFLEGGGAMVPKGGLIMDGDSVIGV